MKKFLSMVAVAFTLGLSGIAMDAEAAKRMGSGKSMGMQRQSTVDKAPSAPATATAATPAAGAANAASSRSWMGPVAGLAAGLGLAALASHLGFGDELASMLLIGLLAFAVMVAIGFLMRKRAASQQSASSSRVGLQYAHVTSGSPSNESGAHQQQGPAYKVSMPGVGGSAIGSGIGSAAVGSSRIPADFDSASFERNAKVNFIRLQAANDAGNLSDIRQFTTPEMFAEISLEMAERGASTQNTEVLHIDAKVVEVEEDASQYLVSVRFTGLIREAPGMQDESFDEVWHLIKSRHGTSGWVLSGIQQMS